MTDSTAAVEHWVLLVGVEADMLVGGKKCVCLCGGVE